MTTWFSSKAWLHNWNILPHPSTDSSGFASAYFANPALWDRAFRFLKEADLNAIIVGTHEIMPNELFANVQEYDTLDEAKTAYEAHRRFADIQYLISGSERIGVMPLEKTSVAIPYDEGKDIVFLNAESDVFHLATPEHFFVFLPGDAHRPCVKYHQCGRVKKIVLKVKL